MMRNAYNCNTFLFCMGNKHKKCGQNNGYQWGNCRHPEVLLIPFTLLVKYVRIRKKNSQKLNILCK